MKQRYTEICNNPENLYMLSHEYSSKLVMFYIEPRLGQNKIIYCYSLNELKQCLSQEEKLVRHSPIEVKYNFRTANATRQEYEDIQLWKALQDTYSKNWIYLLPTGTFVDSSFVDCINNKKNTIKLSLLQENVYVFKSFGISAIHERPVSIYKAEPVDRCSILNELKLDFKCDESNVFLEDEIIETIEEPVNQWIGNMVNDAVESAWSQSTAASQRRERAQGFREQKDRLEEENDNDSNNDDNDSNNDDNDSNNDEDVDDNDNDADEDVNVHTETDDQGRIISIERTSDGEPYSSDDIPTSEYFEYDFLIKNEDTNTEEKCTLHTSVWMDMDGRMDRYSEPALIKKINNDFILEEQWWYNGSSGRRDDTTQPWYTSRFYPSGRIQKQKWSDNVEKYSVVMRYNDNNNFINWRIYDAPINETSNDDFKAEGFYQDGKKRYDKQFDSLTVYDISENPIIKYKKHIGLFVYSIGQSFYRKINDTGTTILNRTGKVRTIDLNQFMVGYKQKNNSYFKRVQKKFKTSIDEFQTHSNIVLQGNDSVVVFNDDSSVSQRISYNNSVIESVKIGSDYIVEISPSGETKTMLDQKEPIENKINRIKVDSAAIQERDNMDNKYMLYELNIQEKSRQIKTFWKNPKIFPTIISSLLEILDNNNYILRIMNNCEEYDTDPFRFDEIIEEYGDYRECINFLEQ